MKFVIQNLLSLREWQTHSEVYANALEDCRLAEELGFDAVWLAEHHFSAYGICPSLAVLAAAIARETRRVRIGTAAVSPDTFELAARRGLKILTAPSFTPFDILKKNYDTYREAWRASHGSDGGSEICLNKIVHVAESSRQAREDSATWTILFRQISLPPSLP